MNEQQRNIGRLEGFLLAHNAPPIVMHAFASLQKSEITIVDVLDEELRRESETIVKTRKPRKPLSEDSKAKLRGSLEKARIAKAAKTVAPINIEPPPKPAATIKAGKSKNQ